MFRKVPPRPLLNIGCGDSLHVDWINVDANPNSSQAISVDVREGLPFDACHFEAVYCSHMLEHLSPSQAGTLAQEMYRVLRPGGIVRTVVPDLERIAKQYLEALENVRLDGRWAEANYDWMMLELYDQAVREFSGGEMGRYLSRADIPNRDFVHERLGFEAARVWGQRTDAGVNSASSASLRRRIVRFATQCRYRIAGELVALIAGREARAALAGGVFRRSSGEIHRWMYDEWSLSRLLKSAGFQDVARRSASESAIPDFHTYGLDVRQGKVRKPDSLFLEAVKP